MVKLAERFMGCLMYLWGLGVLRPAEQVEYLGESEQGGRSRPRGR